MKPIHTLTLSALIANPASAVTVVSKVVDDGWLFNQTNRDELILNNTGSNTGRWAAARFDTAILSAQAFTDSGQYTLTSATLTLQEDASRDANNGTLSGRVGAAFYDTAANDDWTATTAPTGGWSGNTGGRPGNHGTTGISNIDERSNGAAALTVGLTSPATAGDGTSWVNHTFTTSNSAETATIDLTNGGATLTDIQSVLASWVAGNNAGLLLAGEFGNQSFWGANDVASGNSVGSTIDGVATSSGNSLEAGNGEAGRGAFLTLEFTAIPEPSTGLVGALAGLMLLRRRR
ncbi:MAG: PEP-CTERM sorting domain-containing protein [Verrucomicrobiaceae bacterium]